MALLAREGGSDMLEFHLEPRVFEHRCLGRKPSSALCMQAVRLGYELRSSGLLPSNLWKPDQSIDAHTAVLRLTAVIWVRLFSIFQCAIVGFLAKLPRKKVELAVTREPRT